jgi:hypothetical protein
MRKIIKRTIELQISMRLLNNALSDLKAYARKEYSLTNNSPVLVMLITEQEHSLLEYNHDNIVKDKSQNAATQTDLAKEENVPICAEEFFPNVAGIFVLAQNYSSKVRPIVTPILREAFDIPHFGKYKYAIIIREEKLLEWGSQMDIQVDGVQASGMKRKLTIFYRILTQEFLHVVEVEKGIQIFEGNETTDSAVVQKALKAVKIFRDINIFSE